VGAVTRWKTRAAEVALALVSCLVALLVGELIVRARGPVAYMRPLEPTPDDAWAQMLHQPSAIPGLSYELVPNREREAVGTLVRTNSFGMRDDEPRPAGEALRVVVLGDSFTFGFGVDGDRTYPNVLERLLDESSNGRPFDVLNFGVGGYSTRDEALVLEHKALAWDPVLIVVGYTLNDPEIDPIQPLHQRFQQPRWWQHSALLRLLAYRRYRHDKRVLGGSDYYRYLHAEPRKWRSVVDAFSTMGRLAHERGVPALVVIFPETLVDLADYPYADLHRRVAEAARGAGLTVLDLLDVFSAYPSSELALTHDDDHPSPLAHRLAAQAIRDWMVAAGLVEAPRP